MLTRIPRLAAFAAPVLGLLLGLGAQAITSPALAQGEVKAVHGDWQMRCDTLREPKASSAPSSRT